MKGFNSKMFVRVKKRKGKNYAYLVKNEWTSRGTRQKVIKYLGRVVEIDKREPANFNVDELIKSSPEEFVIKTTQNELKSLGFTDEKDVMKLGSVEYNKKTHEIKKDGKKAVIKNNEGFMCQETINDLLNFARKDYEKVDKDTRTETKSSIIKNLANKFLEAGLPANENYFIILADKILSERKQKEESKTELNSKEEENEEFYY